MEPDDMVSFRNGGYSSLSICFIGFVALVFEVVVMNTDLK